MPPKKFEIAHSRERKGFLIPVACLPKDEGGLGIRRLEVFNVALMVHNIWKLITFKDSLWVKWIQEYKLKGRSFWSIPMRGNISWGWRKMLELRPIIREFFWSNLGDGSKTSLWFDKWCDAGPIEAHVTMRDVHRAGLSINATVKDIVTNGMWRWPVDLLSKYPILHSCMGQLGGSAHDCLIWRDGNNTSTKFSVQQVWDSIRPRDHSVPWCHTVWFPQNIPRHAFNLWLIVKHKLKTQDRIMYWDASSSLGSVCSLCECQADSHEHLFFQCPFASNVWNQVKGRTCFDSLPPDVYGMIVHINPIAKRRTTAVIVSKLVVASAAYYIWQERNWRLFKKSKRTVTQIVESITSAVRLKLLSCHFKKSKESEKYARLWELPDSIFIIP